MGAGARVPASHPAAKESRGLPRATSGRRREQPAAQAAWGLGDRQGLLLSCLVRNASDLRVRGGLGTCFQTLQLRKEGSRKQI